MLSIKQRVVLGEDVYKVTLVDKTKLPCVECDIRDCYKNKYLDALKAMSLVRSCVDLIPINTCFKKVEQSPQVDCK
jgi:hypothetical protein